MSDSAQAEVSAPAPEAAPAEVVQPESSVDHLQETVETPESFNIFSDEPEEVTQSIKHI